MTVELDPLQVAGAPGPGWCRAWTERVDHALSARFTSEGGGGLAVVALGSYARGHLCPSSDVDVLVLHNGWGRADLSDVVGRLCYPLWDAGLQVGHGVRTPNEAVRAASERTDVATTLADRRLVVGDRGLFDDLVTRSDRWLTRQGRRLVVDLDATTGRRRAQHGRVAGALEPQLKEGAGGLRDLDTLRWAAAGLLGEASLDALVSARYISAGDRRLLADSRDQLLAARVALHLALLRGGGRRRGDVLRLDLQDEVARLLGESDASALLHGLGLASRGVSYLFDRAWSPLLEDAERGRRWLRSTRVGRSRSSTPQPLGPGLELRDGLVVVDDGWDVRRDAALGLRAVAAAARHRTWLHRESADRLRRELHDRRAAGAAPLAVDEVGRRALLNLLREGSRGRDALADADHLRLLEAHLPEWAAVRGRPQRNPFHLYDLDTHLVQTVAHLVDIARGSLRDRDAALGEGLEDFDLLLLVAFLHDVGKAWPGDHSEVGADLVAAWLARMGFDEGRQRRAATLVRHHLLLPTVAEQRDLDDPAELRAVADAVGDGDLLDMLYLLSLADARATGPSAHSAWKDGLLAELHRRVHSTLRGGATSALPDAEQVADDARALSEPDDELETFLATVDDRYLVAAGARQVLVHARLAAGAAGRDLRAAVRPAGSSGAFVVSVVVADRLGLVARCAGVLAAHGLDVLDARAFTSRFGTALDWFVVRPRPGAHTDGDWERVLADLVAADEGRLAVASAVRDRERRRDGALRPQASAPGVELRLEPGPDGSLLEVHAADRPGMLYRLAHVLEEEGVDIRGARVVTEGLQARDVFFLRGSVTADDRLLHRLRSAAAGDVPHRTAADAR